ncbi:hypothetical protein SeMB42_g02449 [Synchytrium endobioticum]|uniref:Peptidase M48 domain-containing protein n=1 Tax=Synchytrium endobioticum TaxID=286115 RepID=A0A507DGC3_9FUNG|nr:hypothetical protein SeLEV6574_g02664 [Synchytrium endobioticum]TPX49880.1 hypothetical protein SeMB42_g02449 [Synchytrium endobioticum]
MLPRRNRIRHRMGTKTQRGYFNLLYRWNLYADCFLYRKAHPRTSLALDARDDDFSFSSLARHAGIPAPTFLPTAPSISTTSHSSITTGMTMFKHIPSVVRTRTLPKSRFLSSRALGIATHMRNRQPILFKRSFRATEPREKSLFLGAWNLGFYNILRIIITAVPVLWKWNFFKKYPRTMWGLVGLAGLSTAGWIILSYEQHPLTQRGRFMFIDEATELKIAETFYRDFITKHINRFLPPNHPDFIKVKHVASDIVTVVGPVRDWELFVVDDVSISNAFVLATGKIFVYRGLLADCPTTSHLAAVLSHEISHVLSRHAVEKIGFSQLTRILYDTLHSTLYTLSVNLPVISDILGRTVDASEQILTQLPYSRMCETEADTIGIYLMSMSGYDPRASVDLWERWARAEEASHLKPIDTGGEMIKVPELLSDHPSHAHRAQDLRDHVEGALTIFNARHQLQEGLRLELQKQPFSRTEKSAVAQLTIDEIDRALFKVLECHTVSQPFWWAKDSIRQDILEKALAVSSLKKNEEIVTAAAGAVEIASNSDKSISKAIRYVSLPVG